MVTQEELDRAIEQRLREEAEIQRRLDELARRAEGLVIV